MGINKIELKLENFEGPLDLLLYLIQKNKMQINTINISELISEYLKVIEANKQDDLNIKVEFLITACELLEMKALEIINQRQREEEEEKLRYRLEEYKIYKELSKKLYGLEKIYNRSYNLDSERKIKKLTSSDFDNETLTLTNIFESYKQYFDDQKEKLTLNLEKKFDLNDEIKNIEKVLLENRKKISVKKIFNLAISKLHLVYIFLGVLELYKNEKIILQQKIEDENNSETDNSSKFENLEGKEKIFEEKNIAYNEGDVEIILN